MQFPCGFGRRAALPIIAVTFLLLAARPAGATSIDTAGTLPDEGLLTRIDVPHTGEYDRPSWGGALTGAFDPDPHHDHHFGEGGWTGADPDGFHPHHIGMRTARTPEAPSVLSLGLGLAALLLGVRMARRRTA